MLIDLPMQDFVPPSVAPVSLRPCPQHPTDVQQTCLKRPGAILVSPVKAMSVKQMKRQEAQSRMAALRKARRSPAAAAALQRRASLVSGGAKWRITNLKQVARAIAQWR